MPPETLSTRALNRALLARQGLLERHDAPLPRAAERVGGIQAQYAPSIYVGLWSRVVGVEREAVTRALERGSLLQGTLMRTTIHAVSPRDFRLLWAGINASQRAWWLRATRLDPATADFGALARRVRGHLAGGPLKAPELAARLAADGFPAPLARAAGLAVPLVRVPPSGTWERRRADLLGLLPPGEQPGEEEGLRHVLRRYLQGFGPAALAEAADWAGVPVTALKPAAARLRLRRFRSEDGKELLDLPRAPLPDPDTPAPPHFLPHWDATLLVHARRTDILPERYRGRIFSTRTPHSFATFLVDGRVAGTWRHERGRIRLEPFGRLDRATRRAVEEAAEPLADFHRD